MCHCVFPVKGMSLFTHRTTHVMLFEFISSWMKHPDFYFSGLNLVKVQISQERARGGQGRARGGHWTCKTRFSQTWALRTTAGPWLHQDVPSHPSDLEGRRTFCSEKVEEEEECGKALLLPNPKHTSLSRPVFLPAWMLNYTHTHTCRRTHIHKLGNCRPCLIASTLRCAVEAVAKANSIMWPHLRPIGIHSWATIMEKLHVAS